MEISAPSSPVRDVYGRMRRLSAAIDDPDSSTLQRHRWTQEYVDLATDLSGVVGARAAVGAELVDRAGRSPQLPDGRVPRVGDRADLYL